jgi:catechol 2,3-dioxygenase-like lactoylglutathione lyase family enzyme
MMSKPCGLSHVAVVTADLDGFRSFYESTIGLQTTMVHDAGPGHLDPNRS